eukprot:3569601-Prymnesium_polylepis.2
MRDECVRGARAMEGATMPLGSPAVPGPRRTWARTIHAEELHHGSDATRACLRLTQDPPRCPLADVAAPRLSDRPRARAM